MLYVTTIGCIINLQSTKGTQMLNFKDSADITILHTIEHHLDILWTIDQGERGYTEQDKLEVKKELAEMEAEMKRRYPDAN